MFRFSHFELYYYFSQLSLPTIIITIIVSSNVIGALAALFFTNHSAQL